MNFERRHSVHVHLQGLTKCQVYASYTYCHQTTLRVTVAVEPPPCPRTFQNLAEPEPLETDVAFVSKVVTRAARLLKIC